MAEVGTVTVQVKLDIADLCKQLRDAADAIEVAALAEGNGYA